MHPSNRLNNPEGVKKIGASGEAELSTFTTQAY